MKWKVFDKRFSHLLLCFVGNAVFSRAAVPAQASVERSRSQGSAVSQGATAKEVEVPIDVPEMSEKGTCLKGKPNNVHKYQRKSIKRNTLIMVDIVIIQIRQSCSRHLRLQIRQWKLCSRGY